MSSHGHGAHGAHETQDFEFTHLLWIIPASIVLLVVYTTVCLLGYRGAASEEMIRKHSILADTTSKAFFAKEKEILSSYGWQDKEAGKVRIPVKQAMDLVVSDYAKPTQPAGQAK